MSLPNTSPAGETVEQAIARLTAENESLKANQIRPKRDTTKLIDGLSVAVSDKGAISIYGLGRFPVTLYLQQLSRLAAVMPMILAWTRTPAVASKLVSKPVAVK